MSNRNESRFSFESSTITEGSRYFLVGAVIATFLVGIAFEDFTYFFFFYLIWFREIPYLL